jgi:hypothetical protein
VAALIVIIIFNFALPNTIGTKMDDWNYRVVNTINPLSYVLQSKNHTDIDNRLASIAEVVNIEKLRQEQTPYENSAWWNGGSSGVLKQPLTNDQKNNYTTTVVSFLLENIGIYFAGRMETFFATTGFNKYGFRYEDEFRTEKWEINWSSPPRLNMALNNDRPFPKIFDFVNDLIIKSTVYHGFKLSGSVLFWNFLPWLAILLLSMFSYRLTPGIALASFVILSRIPAVFLAAPASHFKYYFSVELSGIFLLCAGLYSIYSFIKRICKSGGDT